MNPYTKFLNLLQAVSKLDKFPTLTPISRLLLDQIALHEDAGSPLTVRVLIGHAHIASPATLHKHLARLRSSGLVTTITIGDDKRTKHLVLTSSGKCYVDQLSKAIVKAASV